MKTALTIVMLVAVALPACKKGAATAKPEDELRKIEELLRSVDTYLGILHITEPTHYSIYADIGNEKRKLITSGQYEGAVRIAIALHSEDESAKVSVSHEAVTITKPLKDVPISKVAGVFHLTSRTIDPEFCELLKVESEPGATAFKVYAEKGKPDS